MHNYMKWAGFRTLLEMTWHALEADKLGKSWTPCVDIGDGAFDVHNREAFIEVALAGDEAIVAMQEGWIRFVWSNDVDDCISDYSVSLDSNPEFKRVLRAAELAGAGKFTIAFAPGALDEKV